MWELVIGFSKIFTLICSEQTRGEVDYTTKSCEVLVVLLGIAHGLELSLLPIIPTTSAGFELTLEQQNTMRVTRIPTTAPLPIRTKQVVKG